MQPKLGCFNISKEDGMEIDFVFLRRCLKAKKLQQYDKSLKIKGQKALTKTPLKKAATRIDAYTNTHQVTYTPHSRKKHTKRVAL